MVIDMYRNFHLTFGREILLKKEVIDKKFRFSKEKDARGNQDDDPVNP